MSTNFELLAKPLEDLTKAERDYLKNELNERDKRDLQADVEALKHSQIETTRRMNKLEEEQFSQSKEIKQIKEINNVLAHPQFDSLRREFRQKANSRVNYLLGDFTSPESICFKSFFNKGIYGTIEYELELGHWDMMSMENYENPDSIYETAKGIRDSWRPSATYFQKCLDELIKKRDKGYLPPYRCRALTDFLTATNNGVNVSFVR